MLSVSLNKTFLSLSVMSRSCLSKCATDHFHHWTMQASYCYQGSQHKRSCQPEQRDIDSHVACFCFVLFCFVCLLGFLFFCGVLFFVGFFVFCGVLFFVGVLCQTKQNVCVFLHVIYFFVIWYIIV